MAIVTPLMEERSCCQNRKKKVKEFLANLKGGKFSGPVELDPRLLWKLVKMVGELESLRTYEGQTYGVVAQ